MSIRYYNQTAPFWDFVASMEEQSGRTRDTTTNNNNENNNEDEGNNNAHEGPWGGFPFMFGPWGGRGGRGYHHRGPPPPPAGEPDVPGEDGEPHDGPSHPPGPPHPEHGSHPHGHHHGPGPHRGRCGKGRGGFAGRGREHWGGRGRHGFPHMGPFQGLAEAFQDQLFGGNESSRGGDETFKPEIDVFDTSEAFVIHVSLPGAKKEDIAVNWDAEKSELGIGGVVYRPGDEDFLKTLAMDERKIGIFERKVRLGSRANPAQVDVDGISAKMEDGVLKVNVPKLDSGYVEIKKVDIE